MPKLNHRVILLICFLLGIISCKQSLKDIKPVVKDGVLDLSQWDLEKNGSVNLDGNWEFYWSNLYAPDTFISKFPPVPDGYCAVPGTWNKQANPNKNYPGIGFATYRLRIITNGKNQLIGLKIPDMSSSYRMYVNSNLLSENGVVSSDPELSKPKNLPLIKVFQNNSKECEIVVHVSNNFHANGGIWSRITMGTLDAIMKTHNNNYMYSLFLCGICFILFVYHLWIYLLRRKELTALAFGLFCLFILLRTIVTDERILFVLFPNFNMNLGLRIEYFTFIACAATGAAFYRFLTPKEFSIQILRLIIAISCIEILIIFLAPTSFYSSITYIFQILLLSKGSYCMYINGMSIKNKRQGSIPFFISSLILILCSINDILYANIIIQSTYIIAYGFLFFIISQAYLLSFNITKAFNTAELTTANLEQKVLHRTMELQLEKEKSDHLLHNILPEEVATELKLKGSAEAKSFENATVMFTDFKGFTNISENLTPSELVAEIHACYTAFDNILEKYGVEKIKTIGDSYMCASGIPVPSSTHAIAMVNTALEIQQFMEHHIDERKKAGKPVLEIRIGIHSGAVVAGIVGVRKFAYDIWGDTVNIASRMESSGEAGKINISSITYNLVKDAFECVHRGKIEAKNKGEIDMYFVESRKT